MSTFTPPFVRMGNLTYECGIGFQPFGKRRYFIVGDLQKLLHMFCLSVSLGKRLMNVSFMETKLKFLGSVM
jgi:hypothetical protein